MAEEVQVIEPKPLMGMRGGGRGGAGLPGIKRGEDYFSAFFLNLILLKLVNDYSPTTVNFF